MPEEERDTVADNPLHKRLGMRPGASSVIIAPPDEDANPLLPLPDGFAVLGDANDLASMNDPLDYIHFFARNRSELTRAFTLLRDSVSPGASLWISWLKQSSGRHGSGLPGDLNENVIRRLALTNGLVDVKVTALDDDWSALKLVRRKH